MTGVQQTTSLLCHCGSYPLHDPKTVVVDLPIWHTYYTCEAR